MTIPQLSIQLSEACESVEDWCHAQSPDYFNEEIVSGKWPISHHIYHLVKSNNGASYAMNLNKLILRYKFGKNNRVERSYSELRDKYLNTLQELSPVSPVQGYSAQPGREFDFDTLMSRYKESMVRCEKSLIKWNEKSMSKYVVPHPAIGKLTMRELIYFTHYHNLHHLQNLKENYIKN